MNHLFQTRCEDWPLGVEVDKMAVLTAFPSQGPLHIMCDCGWRFERRLNRSES